MRAFTRSNSHKRYSFKQPIKSEFLVFENSLIPFLPSNPKTHERGEEMVLGGRPTTKQNIRAKEKTKEDLAAIL